jgi:hypothetical protein
MCLITWCGIANKELKTAFGDIVLDPNNLDEDEQLMKTYETAPATITVITNPDFMIGRPNLKFIRTN